jgi:predicted amidohydrolase YtcJ
VNTLWSLRLRAGVIAVGAMLASNAALQTPAADLVYVGRFVTLAGDSGEASALAVRGGRIVAVGTEAAVAPTVDATVPRVRFEGVGVPGLADAHVHALAFGEQLEILDLRGLSKADVVERVAARTKRLAPGSWVVGRGWDQGFWRPAAFPTAADLDAVSPAHPVLLTRIDGHSVWANSVAMRLAGITAQTRDPDGGYLMRDATGVPTGILVDAATELVERIAPEPTRAQLKARLKAALAEYVRLGLTSVHDAGVDLQGIELYRELLAAGELPLRVYVMAQGTGPTAARLLSVNPDTSVPDHRLVIRSFKVLLDGALGSRGAQLSEPYADADGQRGLELMTDAALGEFVRTAAARGYQINAHAIGDRAVSRALDAFERHGGPDLAARRFRIEHASVISTRDLPRFAALQIVASMQPNFVGEYSRWAADRLGPVRVERVMPVKDLLASGAKVAAGSDYPAADSGDPLVTLYSLVTRMGARGTPAGGWLPAQKIDVHAALKAMTAAPAYAAFQEQDLGALTPGRLADFTVLSADPRSTPAERLKDLSVEMTVVGGVRVFESHPSRAAGDSGS